MKKILGSLAVAGATLALAFGGATAASAGTQAVYTNECSTTAYCYINVNHPSSGTVTVKVNHTGTGTQSIPWALSVGGTTYCSSSTTPAAATQTVNCTGVPAGSMQLQSARTGGSTVQLTLQF